MVFDIYKPGQGKNTRLFSAFGLAILAALGCWKLYQQLQARDLNMWVETLVPVGIFIVLAFLIFLLVNGRKTADFMISAEGEMKKVSWSSRQEIAVSTLVVIIVVVCMAILLGTTDLGFQTFFGWLLK
ncbi:MAG: preprotein translocase subunit SecE [Sedimentisphaerales bacterium]|jgi:preprotein translocase SecE subunit